MKLNVSSYQESISEQLTALFPNHAGRWRINMESDREKIRALRHKQRQLTSEEFLDQVERHLGKRP